MLRHITKICCLSLLVAGTQRASAFSLIGNFETWQQPVVSFRIDTQLGGSRNLGDEYRINLPVITYGFTSAFLDYFGSNGVSAVDQAFKILNDLPAVSKATTNLTEFLTDDAQRTVESAAALNLLDLKSTMLSLMMEQMGLYGEEHVFDLRSRGVPPGSPPPCTFLYTVIVRNFDPVSYEPSHYVNGVLYSYQIVDGCPTVERGDAFETLVDPTDFAFNAVATFGLRFGGYYLNLTRDDFGGLRYLYRKNNYNNELLPPDTRVTTSSVWSPVDTSTNAVTSTNSAALRGGLEKIRFKKVKFNSQLGSSFKPFVQKYSLSFVTNNSVKKQTGQRDITSPDILFTAADIADSNPAAVPFLNPLLLRSMSYATVTTVDTGPGTILPQKVITLNKIGPYFRNTTSAFIEDTASQGFLWGSFDGTTNAPIVYPNGTSVADIEAQVLH